MKKIGFIINPIAGIGGKVGLKGSDGEDIQRLAFEKGAEMEAEKKTKIALEYLLDIDDKIKFYTAPSIMGENLIKEMGFEYTVVGDIDKKTTYKDTEIIANKLKEYDLDLLVFSGGDGTARNIYNAIGLSIPVIGIPAGVKIHSAVYANNPGNGGEAIKEYLLDEDTISLRENEVMDIDEELFRQNRVEAKLYGYLMVPEYDNLIQNHKTGTAIDGDSVLGIMDEIVELTEDNEDSYFLFGTGSTNYNIMKGMGLEGSLLGVDIVHNGKVILLDGTEEEIYNTIKDKDSFIIVTIIGGQGHILGRGNQQLSPRVIREVGVENLVIVSTATKINELGNKPLLVDTSDPELDKEIAGYRKVIVNWGQASVRRIEC